MRIPIEITKQAPSISAMISYSVTIPLHLIGPENRNHPPDGVTSGAALSFSGPIVKLTIG